MEKTISLAACYTVFNACELLKGSIEQIYDHVNHFIICYQSKSNKGFEISIKDKAYIIEIQKLDKIHIIEYIPNLSLSTKENERRKHQTMIDKAKRLNCSHFLMSATDHYYKEEEFVHAKKIVIAGNYDLTASQMFTYYKEPSFQLTPIEDYYMPFIMKLKPDTRITSTPYDFIVDPSVRIEPVNSQRLFRNEELMMHHYSMVRKDIESKFNNSASAGNWKDKITMFLEEYNSAKAGSEISYFKGRKIIKVNNYFDIK